MKKILAVTLAVLMLLPVFAGFASADFVLPEGTETKNVAGDANIEIVDTNNQNISIDSNVDASALIDGDKSTGTSSPQGKYYSYVLNFDETQYFTDIVVACNGKGTLADGTEVTVDTYNVYKLIVKVYFAGEVTYQSEIINTRSTKEITVEANAKGDRVEIYKVSGLEDRTEYMWEIETYAPDMELCSAQVENVASEAVFSATGANANYWWAMDYKSWVDGDPLTGSHSPKGRNYSVWMNFSSEHLFSQIDIVCNTDGGARLSEGTTLTDRTYNNGMLRVIVYNNNEDLVWDSDLVDTSTVTTLSVAPYVEGAIIEIQFFNGTYSGNEYMYEVSAYAQTGEHVFTQTSEENPTCLVPGYKELTCHCGKVIKQSIDATGFHKWNEGEVTKGASPTSNGVKTVTCTVCESTKLYDVAATGHTWDEGKVVPPTCDVEGYTLYTCTCEGGHVDTEGNTYVLTYKGNPVDALVHNWDDGEITKFPTVEEEGVITYKCSVCNGEKYGRIRKHKYTDSTLDITTDNVSKIEQTITTDFAGMNPNVVLDGDLYTNWYGPTASYIDITLDREYVLTSGFFYASSNYTFMKVEFLGYNPDFDPTKAESEENSVLIVNATFNTGAIDNGSNENNPKELDMLDTLKSGVKTKVVRITTIDPKWPNGSASRVHEIKLKAHKCEVSEIDYVHDSTYVAPSCNTNGKCYAICQVCGLKNEVVIEAGPDAGHNYEEVIADTPATCVENGVGHGVCTKCNETISGVTIPATGKHKFTVDDVVVSAKCGFAGVGNIICENCGKVDHIYEIAPTGIHEHEWTTKSQASYTAVGKTEYSCIYCDHLGIDPETNEDVKVAEKIAIPEDIITFVGANASSNAESGNTLSFTYKIKLEYLEEIEQTCDVRVITTITDATGREAVIESYGKYAAEGSYNCETGEFTITIYPKAEGDVFEISTAIRLMNFRGTVYKYFAMGDYGTSLSMSAVK